MTGPGMYEKGAVLSPCVRYRYRLWRRWAPAAPQVTWIMLNPSTADADSDDPTIRRCMRFAEAWGYGGIDVVNLFAWRATDPRALRAVAAATQDVARVVGPDNAEHIDAATRDAGWYPPPGQPVEDPIVVAAWGNHGDLYDRGRHLRGWLAAAGRPVWHLGPTASGQPLHPLARGRHQVPLSTRPQLLTPH